MLVDQSLHDGSLSVYRRTVEGESALAADDGVEWIDGGSEGAVRHGWWCGGDELQGEVGIIGRASFVETVRCVVGYGGEFVRERLELLVGPCEE